MSEATYLKPCPFCGMEVELRDRAGDKLIVFACPDESPCHGSGLGIYALSESREAGVMAWNRRALPQDVIDLIIAARIVAFEDQSQEALDALDKASEEFADRVPWEDTPPNP